jgi:hypothetical protein
MSNEAPEHTCIGYLCRFCEEVDRESHTTRLVSEIATLRDVIQDFCRERLAGQPTFHLAELVAAAQRQRGRSSNASSVDRVLRILRQEGHLGYRVLDRGASLYELQPIERSAP